MLRQERDGDRCCTTAERLMSALALWHFTRSWDVLKDVQLSEEAIKRNQQLTLGISFVAAAVAVMGLSFLRVGHCRAWFGGH